MNHNGCISFLAVYFTLKAPKIKRYSLKKSQQKVDPDELLSVNLQQNKPMCYIVVIKATMCLRQKNPTTDIFSSTITILTIAFGMPKIEKHNEFSIHLSKRNQ